MPIYEYRCESCSHEFETIQKVSDAPLTTCPACSAESLRKKVSAAGFRLKGGGWYETDFKAGKKKNVAGEGAGEAAGGADKGGDGAASSKDTSGASDTGSAAKAEGSKGAGGSGGATGATSKAKTD